MGPRYLLNHPQTYGVPQHVAGTALVSASQDMPTLLTRSHEIELQPPGELDEGIQKGWKTSSIHFVVCVQGKGGAEVDLGADGHDRWLRPPVFPPSIPGRRVSMS